MRDPLPQPLTLDFDQILVRNPWRAQYLLGFSGMIVMWSGNFASIPPGWAVCDGRQNTPDLRDRFVVGARADLHGVAKCSLTDVPTQRGGSVQHTHAFTTNGHLHGTKSGGPFTNTTPGIDLVSEKDSGTTAGPSGVPIPYFALVFIMKL